MTKIILALITGAVVGIVFFNDTTTRSSDTLWYSGNFGIYLGGKGYSWIIERFFS